MSSLDAAAKLTPAETFTLITRDLHEVLGGDAIKAILEATPSRPVRAYWGTAPTSRPHIGYFAALVKIADFLRAGVMVKVLLADIHAFLDNLKAPIELVKHRVQFYKNVLIAVFRAIGVPTERLVFVVGSEYQLTEAYTMDVYRAAALTSEHDSKKAGAEVVKQVASPLLSSMLYPGLQALDEQYLDVDFQFGGVDQRKIFTFAEALLPKLGYKKRAHLMNPMVPGLKGAKMSASDHASKIDFLDTEAEIRSKIKSAVCEPKSTPADGNGVLAFAKAVLIPIVRLQHEGAEARKQNSPGLAASLVPLEAPEGTVFSIAKPEKFGGGFSFFDSYQALEDAFVSGDVHPADLKKAVTEALITILGPVQKAFQADEEWRKVDGLAYPKEEAPVKKTKVKKVNPRFADKVPVSKGGTMAEGDAAATKPVQPSDTKAGNETKSKAEGSTSTSQAENETFVKGVEGLSVNDEAAKEMQERRQAAQGGNKEEA